MKRMKEIDVKALFAYVADVIDIETIPLNDQKTTFFRTRTLFCYRNAYIKANYPEKFYDFYRNEW